MATPDSTGCMLLMMIQRANIGVSSLTRAVTSESVENNDGYLFRAAIRIIESTRLIEIEDITATTNENFALLGWPAPSSFDTLTLHQFLHVSFKAKLLHRIKQILIHVY